MPPVRATRGRRRTLGAAAVLVLAACLAASCGEDSDTGLSAERAATLRSTLDGVEARVARSDCDGATERANAFRAEVESLPARVDGELREALAGSAARLESLVTQECEPAAAVEEAPAPDPAAPDENGVDQPRGPKKDKKPKKEKPDQQPQDEQQQPPGGATGPEGSTGATGPSGGAAAPEGG